MARTMRSKYPGWCKSCKGKFPAGAEIVWSRATGARHSTEAACDVAKAAWEVEKAKRSAVRGHADLTGVIEFIAAARERGLKFPKLRVLDSDGEAELVLGLTGERSKVPGSVTVKRDGEYVGLVRPNGDVIGAWDAPELFTDALIAHLAKVGANPAELAKAYAEFSGACSFCGTTITDAGSIEVGYGPGCAKHWGLPHKYAGVRASITREELEVLPDVPPGVMTESDWTARENSARH